VTVQEVAGVLAGLRELVALVSVLVVVLVGSVVAQLAWIYRAWGHRID
jgi:uncharacterized transporter YbjL